MQHTDCHHMPMRSHFNQKLQKLKSHASTINASQCVSLYWNLCMPTNCAMQHFLSFPLVNATAVAMALAHSHGHNPIFIAIETHIFSSVYHIFTMHTTLRCNFIQFKWIAAETVVVLCQFLSIICNKCASFVCSQCRGWVYMRKAHRGIISIGTMAMRHIRMWLRLMRSDKWA